MGWPRSQSMTSAACRVGREHRVEDLLDVLPREDQREPLHEGHPLDVERRQPQRVHEGEIGVAEHLEGHVQPLDHLLLIFGGLRTEAEHLGAELLQVLVVIAKGARLRRAAAGAGNRVPSGQEGLARHSRARVAVDDDARRRHRREVDPAVAGRPELDLRHGQAGQMFARAVVDGHGQIRGQRLRRIPGRRGLSLRWSRLVGHRPEAYAGHGMDERPSGRRTLHRSSPSRLSRSGRSARRRGASVKRRPVPPCLWRASSVSPTLLQSMPPQGGWGRIRFRAGCAARWRGR